RIKYYRELNQREKQLRSSGDALNKAFGSPLELKWTQGANNWYLTCARKHTTPLLSDFRDMVWTGDMQTTPTYRKAVS
ncbi:MAG: hypothetical protein IJI54_12340, partial [Kiritimatiellae bacterium]|nr:hypothetical protein [Kiritimatiellia bacterium]